MSESQFRPLFLAIEVDGDGLHPAAWRQAAHTPDTLLAPQRTAEVTSLAERYGFNAVTFNDSLLPPQPHPGITARLDAVLRAAYAAPLTGSLGLIPVGGVPFGEPFHVSAQYSTLDHASAGRAGWLVRPDAIGEDGAGEWDAEAAAYGLPIPATDRERVDIASDLVQAARLLWDSWEDEAVIRDAESGRYLDRERIHPVAFTARTGYTIGASAVGPRPPQGQVPVFAVPGSIAPELIDVALVGGATVEEVRARAAEARAAGISVVITEIRVGLDRQGVAAAGVDHPAEAPARGGVLTYAGDGTGLVDLIAELGRDGDSGRIVDGIRLRPEVLDADLEELGQVVLPTLRAVGLSRPPRVGETLRDQLGLDRPDNVFGTTDGAATNQEAVR